MFRHFQRILVSGALALGLLSGCVVHERRAVVVERPPPCRGGFWVQGHYDYWGRWFPPHWVCPG